MKFVLEFSLDTIAFEDGYLVETTKILNRVLLQCASEEQTDSIIRDSNGNAIGKWDVI